MMLVILASIGFLGSRFFLKKYYIDNRINKLISVNEKIQKKISNDTINDEDVSIELENLCRTNNIIALYVQEDGEIIFTNSPEVILLRNRIFGFQNQDDDEGNQNIIKKSDDYIISQVEEKRFNSSYLEIQGDLGDLDGYYLMRIQIEGIDQSISIINYFLVYLLLVLFAVGIIFIVVMSRRITKPIKELTKISNKMASLDFSMKYTLGGKNEIGILGDNFNKMSDTLEDNIDKLQNANAKLKSDLDRITQLNDKQHEFIGNVSHELKTPIALIKGYAEGLDSEIASTKEDRQYYIDVISDEANKMEDLVRKLLELNKAEDIINPTITEVNISQIISAEIEEHRIDIDTNEIQLTNYIDKDIYIKSDEFLIKQVISNFINNAIKYTTGKKEIKITYTIIDSIVKIMFYNSADKFDGTMQEKVWDRFYKGDESHNREQGGHGIGLSIVKEVIKSLGGKCGVYNKDEGVEFFFESTLA